jgi:hypothetical protein
MSLVLGKNDSNELSGITLTDTGLLKVDLSSNSVDTDNGFAQVLLNSAGGTAVKADTTCVVQEDPENREGWNLTNSVAGTKFNLYYFDGTQEIITLGEVLSVYFKAFINVNSGIDSIPFIHIYTKPTGVGDAGAFYHSKIDYLYNNDNTIGIGEECVFYGESEPKTAFSNRKIQLNDKTVNGDGADSEEVLFLVVSSNSGAAINTLNTTINVLGFDASVNNVSRNLNLVSSENPTGLATEATLLTVAGDTTSLDTKITAGNDFTLAEAQQVLVYGEVTSGPGTGELHPIHITNNGDVEVEIADFKKGQELMADSFPVVIASDQSVLDTSDLVAQGSLSSIDTKLTVGDDDTLVEALQTVVYGRKDASPSGLRALKADDQGRLMVDIDTDGVGLATEATLADLNTKVTSGEDDQLSSAQQVLMYGRKDTSPTGLYAMKVNNSGALNVVQSYTIINNRIDTLATGAGGTATSTSVNMINFTFLTFFGSSTNITDPIFVEVSGDNATWYEASEYFVNTNTIGALVNYSINIPNVAGQYWRLKQTDTITTAFTLIVNASRK